MALQYCSQAGMICWGVELARRPYSRWSMGLHIVKGVDGKGSARLGELAFWGMKLGRRAAARNYCRRHGEYNISVLWCFHRHGCQNSQLKTSPNPLFIIGALTVDEINFSS